MVKEGIVVLHKVNTTEQTADMITKPLGKILFSKHARELGMKNTTVFTPK